MPDPDLNLNLESQQNIPDRRLPDTSGPVGKLITKLEDIKTNPKFEKVHWYDRAWAWANGQKLYAGAVLMIVGGVLQFIPGTQAAGWALIGKGTATAGATLAITGFIHKVIKKAGVSNDKELIDLIIKIIIMIYTYYSTKKKKTP